MMVQAADKWNDNYEALWRAAEAIYVYSDTLHKKYNVENYENALSKNQIKVAGDVLKRSNYLDSAQSSELLKFGIMARKYADKAVELKPEGPEGHYYDAMGIATYSYGKSIVKALLEGLAPKYERHLNEVIRSNKGYQNGILFIAYGRYYYELPWPKHSDKKSLEKLLLAEKYNPEDIRALDFLGDTCYDMGRKDDAVKYWTRVMNSTFKAHQGEYIKKLAQEKLKYAGK